MVVIAPAQRATMDERHASERSAASRQPPPPARRNVQSVLDLDNASYFTFRGRLYRAPPLPYKAGERLTDLWLTVLGHPEGPRSVEGARIYYRAMHHLPRLLWRHCRPVGFTRRWLRHLGLHRNPFRDASEQELVDVAAFFFSCRTRSSVGFPPTPPRPARST